MVYLLAALHGGMLLILLSNLVYLYRGRLRAVLNEPPTVSVLVPARNEEANLPRLLHSLLAQTYPRMEIIVYDDGSEDATPALLRAVDDPRLIALRSEGPPPGWVGKVHALYQATRRASGELYLFLDADTELHDPEALRRLVERFAALPPDSILTGLTRLRGGGKLLVSLVPCAILLGLPWPLVRRVRLKTLAALNGQCWLIRASDYHAHEPHHALPDEVLEDVEIGRYLKTKGLTPCLRDVQGDVSVYMYPRFSEAWRGFRKNAYLLMGGSPVAFAGLFAFFALAFLVAPWVSPWLLLSTYVLKATTDLYARFPVWIPLLTPLSYILGALLQVDSAVSHWTGRVAWKGRRVGS
ncbi:glycosyl transferase family 2 [Rhodothermaceae bacterium RA]|nr:glycosyl transferase family 2 [Rhodothermaceae bacterium RA]